MEEVELFGVECIQIENDFLRVAIALDTGFILDYLNKQTERHQLCVAEKCVRINYGRYGIQLPWIARPALATVSDAVTMRAAVDGLEQEIDFRIEPGSGVLVLTQTLTNSSDSACSPDPRGFLNLHPACRSERTAFHLPATDEYRSTYAAHGRHRLFAGKEADWRPEPHWPPHEYFENHEVGRVTYETCSYRENVFTRPRWLAALDTGAQEGIVVRFGRPPGFVRAWLPGYTHAPAITVEHDLPIGQLLPGESTRLVTEIAPITGLSRVDHVGPVCAAGIELTAALRLAEVQETTVRGVAFRSGTAEGKLVVRTNRVEQEHELSWRFSKPGDREQQKWVSGPYGSKETQEAVWYYVHKKPGDCARPTPRVELHLEGEYSERWFAPSPETEEILQRMERSVCRAQQGGTPREMCSGLKALVAQADELRRDRIDPDAMYVLLDRAESLAEASVAEHDVCLIGREDLLAAKGNETTAGMLRDEREQVLAADESFYWMDAPGFDAYTRALRLAHHAGCAAICRVALDDAECGRRAAKALAAFADAYEHHRLTSAGNILHQSTPVPSLVIAFDLVHDLLSPSDEEKVLRFFFDLADLIEGHVNAKGDNDEIHEAGALAWLAARFPYLPGSGRKLRRAHAVLCRQAEAINEDGGWPESPNYNSHVTLAYMAHVILFRRAGMPIDEGDAGAALRRLLDWLLEVMTPDWRIPTLGDGVDRRPPSDTFFLGAQVFRDGRYLAAARKLLAYEQRTAELPLINTFRPITLVNFPSQLEAVPLARQNVTDLPHTGYLILRSGDTPNAEFLIAGYGPYKPGHGHPDKLSFELYAFGENVIRDPGYGIRQTACHNTVTVDGRDQDRICGSLDGLTTETDGLIRATISAETAPGVRHTRLFLYRPGQWLLVHDRLESDEEHEYSWRINFNGRAERLGDQFAYRSAAGPGLLVDLANEPAELQDAEAVTYVQESMGRRPIHRLAGRPATARQKEYLALLVPFADSLPAIHPEWHRGEGTVCLAIADTPETVALRPCGYGTCSGAGH